LFNDSSQVRMTGKPEKIITYVDKYGDFKEMSLEAAYEQSDPQLAKRLEYSKKCLKNLLIDKN
jgi:hypothetical protein